MGKVINLMTKFLKMAIVLGTGWDVNLPLPLLLEELTFWKDNIRFMNGRPIGQRFSAARNIVYSDSSDLGVAGGRGILKGAMVSFATFYGCH